MLVEVLEAAERELPHIVAAGHAPSRFPSRLLGGEEQGEEDADDRDDRQDFNVDEGRAAKPRLAERATHFTFKPKRTGHAVTC